MDSVSVVTPSVASASPVQRHKGGRHGPILASRTTWLACVVLAALAVGWTRAPALAAGEKSCDTTFRSPTSEESASLREWHNPGLAKVADYELCFDGYVSSFAGKSTDLDEDGEPDLLRVPLLVIHRIQAAKAPPDSRKRPSSWFTIDSLSQRGIAPTDQSYVYSQQWRARHPDWFERGHLAQKYLLERVSADAAWFSHNVANAVPQRGRFNKTVWLELECRVGAWANRYENVWVITGPIFQTGVPQAWLKEPRRAAQPVAIPDSLFKVVLRKDKQGWHALSFIMPQQDDRYALRAKQWDLLAWGTSIKQIERLTRQRLLPEVDDGAAIRTVRTTKLWPHHRSEFDPPCVKFVGGDA